MKYTKEFLQTPFKMECEGDNYEIIYNVTPMEDRRVVKLDWFIDGKYQSEVYDVDYMVDKLNDDWRVVEAPEEVKQKHYWKEGEELEIGMVVTIKHDTETEYEVGLVNGKDVCLKIEDQLHVVHIENVREFDTRTDKQKVVDDMFHKVNHYSYSLKDVLELVYDEWVGKDE